MTRVSQDITGSAVQTDPTLDLEQIPDFAKLQPPCINTTNSEGEKKFSKIIMV